MFVAFWRENNDGIPANGGDKGKYTLQAREMHNSRGMSNKDFSQKIVFQEYGWSRGWDHVRNVWTTANIKSKFVSWHASAKGIELSTTRISCRVGMMDVVQNIAMKFDTDIKLKELVIIFKQN